MRMQVLPSGDFIASAVPVLSLLGYAYDMPVNALARLSGLPDWAIGERYDVEAKAPTDAVPSGLPESEVRGRTRQMIRELLADRFHLLIRTEHKTVTVYALSLASGGLKLQKSPFASKSCIFDTDPEGCHNFAGGLGHPLRAKAVDMDDVARYISNWTDLPVVNHTAIGGLFAVNTEGWVPMRLPPPPPNFTPVGNPFAGLPTIFTVLGRLGLELKQQKDTLPVYTLEHIERPASN
jgi:uncharacterized protein (TIGR03435 family)